MKYGEMTISSTSQNFDFFIKNNKKTTYRALSET